MKCPECGRIVRKVSGQLVEHPCKPVVTRRRGRRAQYASREEQYGRYLDSGPQGWDDR